MAASDLWHGPLEGHRKSGTNGQDYHSASVRRRRSRAVDERGRLGLVERRADRVVAARVVPGGATRRVGAKRNVRAGCGDIASRRPTTYHLETTDDARPVCCAARARRSAQISRMRAGGCVRSSGSLTMSLSCRLTCDAWPAREIIAAGAAARAGRGDRLRRAVTGTERGQGLCAPGSAAARSSSSEIGPVRRNAAPRAISRARAQRAAQSQHSSLRRRSRPAPPQPRSAVRAASRARRAASRAPRRQPRETRGRRSGAARSSGRQTTKEICTRSVCLTLPVFAWR